jgi:hypothetical protein
MAVIQQKHIFIDPKNCGSSVGYYITISEYENKKEKKIEHNLTGIVVLADCSHKIDWAFDGVDNDQIEKIDAAIGLLQDFRKQYRAAAQMVSNLDK